MRRPIALLVALLVAVAALSACSPGTPASTDSGAGAGVAPAPSAASAPTRPPGAPATPAGSPAAGHSSPPALASPTARASVALRVPLPYASGAFARPRQLEVPAGFEVSVFAAGLEGPRFLAFSPEGVLFATLPSAGEVVALPDRDGDGVADEIVRFAEGLKQPHGIAFYQGALYVAETNRVARLPYAPDSLRAERVEVVVPSLPTGGGHWTRTVGFGPDGKLYVSAGSSCNVCVESDPRRAAVTQYNPDGSGERVYARGLRNSVGFVWRPGTEDLWATDNGRDYLGDDLPPDEVNVVRDGGDHGWPYCYGERVPDPQYGTPERCAATTPPAVALPAHSATLGLAFYTGTQFPAEYRGDLFVAYHGSWNRSVPTGYKLVRIRMRGATPGPVEDFVTGWLVGGGAWGRPVDPVVGPDGSLYLSDDSAGAVYRIAYRA